MSEQTSEDKNKNKNLKILFAVFAALCAIAAVFTLQSPPTEETKETPTTSSAGSENALAQGEMKNFVFKDPNVAIKNITFADGEGGERSLADWKGKTVLLNLWATWCAPCRKEMPGLSRLQEQLGGDDFEVVALSVDRKGLAASRAFLESIDAKALALYVDESTEAIQQLQAIGLPVTILIGEDGKEIGRLTGPAEWDSPDAIKLVKSALGKS